MPTRDHASRSHAAQTELDVSAPTNKSQWIEKLARLGFCSRGAIYAIIGVLAVLAAIGEGGRTTGSKGALRTVLEAPGGWLVLAVLAIGLIGFTIWRFCQSVLDADGRGSDGRAIAVRTGFFVSGLTHLALAFWAGMLVYRLVAGGGDQGGAAGGGNTKQTLIAWLMSQPFGQWLVGLVGLVVIGVGAAQLVKGYKKGYEKRLNWDEETRSKLSPICRTGLFARGVVFCILGGFIVYAAVTTDSQQAGGLNEALTWLRKQPYGALLFGLTAVGLTAFGVYGFIQGVYRRVDPPA